MRPHLKWPSHLSQLFNYSLDCCMLPLAWKVSNVCPIFKGGDSSVPSIYRPVSPLNTMENVLERIILSMFFNHMKYRNFFTPRHSWFLLGDSTVNRLTYLTKSAGL